MPMVTKESFPTQIKSNFKIISEFFNISGLSYNSIWKKYMLSDNYFIFATVRLNKIVIFFRKIKTFILCNVIRNDSRSLNLLKFSESGTRFSFIVKQKIILLFKSSENFPDNSKRKKSFFFSKILEFSRESENHTVLISSCFNCTENQIFLSFSDGQILFLDFNGKISLVLKTQNPLFNLRPNTYLKSHEEFYAISNNNSLVNFNLLTKKTKNFRYSKAYIVKKNTLICFNKNIIELFCTCHGNILNSLILPWEITKILLIENNKTMVWGHESLGIINLASFEFTDIKFYHFKKVLFQGKIFNLKEPFLKIKHSANFSLVVLSNFDSYLEIKPLTEKINFLTNSSTTSIKNNQINFVEFFGKKNTIAISNNSEYINIFNGRSFKFIGTFFNENMILIDALLKKKFLIITNNSGEIFIFDIVFAVLIKKIRLREKVSFYFFSKQEQILQWYLICGYGNGIVKFWQLMFYNNNQTKLKSIWTKKVAKGTISTISLSHDCKSLALLIKQKKIYLCEFDNLPEYEEIDISEKKIYCMKFSPKKKKLFFGTQDGSIFSYDIVDKTSSKILTGDGFLALGLNFNKRGTLLVANYFDGTIKIVLNNNSITHTINGNHIKPVWSCGISDDEQIITGCSGGQLIILKDISFEISKKQDKKFSKIKLLRKFLRIPKYGKEFLDIFRRLLFTKNSFMLIDFLEFSHTQNPRLFRKIFIKLLNCIRVSKINFILKSLILYSYVKNEKSFIYKIISVIFESLNSDKISKINFSILNASYILLKEWYLNIKFIEKLNE